jgi:serine/threonine-protein kinase
VSHSLPYLLAGRYQLTRRLGEGSFAETFLATDSLLQRQVAVKILREQYVRDPHFATRFSREAQAAAAVSHPNVVEVYDSGQADETLFIVMEWVDGPDLKQLIREQAPLPIPEAIRLLRELLQGLAVIHQAGIIHRDVKPQNVLLTKQGTAKLTDFGIARGAVGSSLTETGMALGTAAYMAPEQASGKPVGPGVDLYAAGVILFELVTGELPFPGENPVRVMYRQVHEPVPRPREVNRAIPPELEGVILRALAKEPEQRYPTAEAMAAALAGVGAAEATRVVTAVPADGERRSSAGPATHDDPPPWPRTKTVATPRVPLSSVAVWLGGILVAFSLAGLILLGSFLGDEDPGTSDDPGVSSSSAAPSAIPSPVYSSSLPPSPAPEPSPTPSPRAVPADEPPAAPPASPSPSAEPDTLLPLPSPYTTRLLEPKESISSYISGRVQDAKSQYAPGP